MKRFALAAAIALLASCSQSNQGNRSEQATPAPQSPQSMLKDALIYAQVEAKFGTIDADSALHVAVNVSNGDVSLSGKVRNAAAAGRFIRAANSVPGVKHVNAVLAVDAKLPSAGQLAQDFALGAAVKGNIAAQAGVNVISIGVGARHGSVTLTGKARTAALKATILQAARTTPGVRRVVDEVQIAP